MLDRYMDIPTKKKFAPQPANGGLVCPDVPAGDIFLCGLSGQYFFFHRTFRPNNNLFFTKWILLCLWYAEQSHARSCYQQKVSYKIFMSIQYITRSAPRIDRMGFDFFFMTNLTKKGKEEPRSAHWIDLMEGILKSIKIIKKNRAYTLWNAIRQLDFHHYFKWYTVTWFTDYIRFKKKWNKRFHIIYKRFVQS